MDIEGIVFQYIHVKSGWRGFHITPYFLDLAPSQICMHNSLGRCLMVLNSVLARGSYRGVSDMVATRL